MKLCRLYKVTSDKQNLLNIKYTSPEHVENTNKENELWSRRRIVTGVILCAVIASIYVSCCLLGLGTDQLMLGATPLVSQGKVISCYFNTPDSRNISKHQLFPSQIHPYLCTHINIAFARVVHKEIYLDQSQYDTVRQVVQLKQDNPSLKVLISVGGQGDNNGFSQMVIDHASRKVFIKSIKNILRNLSLDGIDLDWEFPALHLQENNLRARERQHFSQLLCEIRMEFIRERRDYILTVAIAAPQIIADVSYDVDQINSYVDFANIMTYDFHYYTKFTPFTGLNSPLYARASEELYLATLNINYTVHMYMTKGLDKNKIVVGIPTYGHTFKLVNADNPNVGSPASGFGSLGGLGFVNYPAVCAFREARGVTERYEARARVPYLFRDREWLSYDSPQSVLDKADYIKANELRGAMIYSLNADDYEGTCGARGGGGGAGGRFPLAQSVRRALRAGDAMAHGGAR